MEKSANPRSRRSQACYVKSSLHRNLISLGLNFPCISFALLSVEQASLGGIIRVKCNIIQGMSTFKRIIKNTAVLLFSVLTTRLIGFFVLIYFAALLLMKGITRDDIQLIQSVWVRPQKIEHE